MDFTIGADIEMMLERDGELISAVPILGPNGDELPHGTIFFDNVLAEFTVDPANSKEAFVNNVWNNMEAARALFKNRHVDVRIVSSAHYPDSELQTEEAKLFGCSPDFCAYEVKMNEVAVNADETTLRTAGGHVHFSHPIFEDPFKVIEMIKLMDLHLGIPSLIHDDGSEAVERRTLYGGAGAHRPKDYPGGEYRSLSNFWVKDARLIGWVYEQTAKCLQLLVDGNTVSSLGYDENEIKRIIDEGDKDAAAVIAKELT